MVDCQDGQPKKQRNDIVVAEPDSIEAADRQKYNEGMLRRQAFKYELMPNGEQQRAMRRFAGSCRFVFNKALALQQANHQTGEKFIGYVAMAKRLTEWRNGRETPWLKDAPVHPLQHALKDLVGAINVLERGQRLFACGEDGSGRSRKTTTQPASAKQEPTEATMPEASLA